MSLRNVCLLFVWLITFSFVIDAWCGGLYGCTHYKPWLVTVNDSKEMSHEFQRWLYHRQFNKELCNRAGTQAGWVGNQLKVVGGFGFSYAIMGMNYMFLSFEDGKIYRPTVEFLWANHPPNIPCTLNLTALDCYSRPLSSCKVDIPKVPGAFGYEPMLQEPYVGIFPTKDKIDLCTLAIIARKPAVWVYGNVMMYLLRPRTDLQIKIDDRVSYVTQDVVPGTGFITVHVRGGEPDGKRPIITLKTYMEAVESKASELAAAGKPVSIVYLTSNDNGNIFHSQEFLETHFNSSVHNYRFKILNMTLWEFEKEVEFVVRENIELDRQPLAVEFLSDLSLMVEADAFIGSHSSIYIAAAALRYGKHFEKDLVKHTCFISSEDQHSLICEGNEQVSGAVRKMWSQYICAGGFKGGDGIKASGS